MAPDKPRTPFPVREGTFTRLVAGAVQRLTIERQVERAHRNQPTQVVLRRRLSALGKLVLLGLSLAVLALVAAVVWHQWRAATPDGLRARAAAQVAAQEWEGARVTLDQLRALAGEPAEADRQALWLPVSAGLQQLQRERRQALASARRAKRWDEALAALDGLERAGWAPDQALFARAELLREAGRLQEAVPYYQRYHELYPDSSAGDDALFWQAAALREQGQREQMRALLRRLLDRYGERTDFATTSLRWLEEQ